MNFLKGVTILGFNPSNEVIFRDNDPIVYTASVDNNTFSSDIESSNSILFYTGSQPVFDYSEFTNVISNAGNTRAEGLYRVVISPTLSSTPLQIITFLSFNNPNGTFSYLCYLNYDNDGNYLNHSGSVISHNFSTLYLTLANLNGELSIIESFDILFANRDGIYYSPITEYNSYLNTTEPVLIYAKPDRIYISERGYSNFVRFPDVYLSYRDKATPIILRSYKFTKTVLTEGLKLSIGVVYFDSNSDAESGIIEISYNANPTLTNEVRFILGEAPPYDQNNPSAPDGGGGNYGGNEIYFPTINKIPQGTVEVNDSASSMYTRYAINMSNMSTIGDWFWADEFGLQVAKTAISLLYGDPIQTVISCVSFPFEISSLTGTSSRNLRWGGHDTGISMTALNNNAFQIDWGSVTISEYWGNFLDYSPHTKLQLYLPWGTGFVDIDPNDVMKAKLSVGGEPSGTGVLKVVTNVEVSRGLCVHHVIANDTVIGSYSGSCGRQIPITGSDYASKQVAMAGSAVGSIIGAAISVGSGVASGNANAIRKFNDTGVGYRGPKPITVTRKFNTDAAVSESSAVASKAMRPAIASAAAVAVSPPHVSRSGSFQEGTGSLTIQEPYLIISRPRMSIPASYGNHYGYPSNITLSLGSIRGYTEIGSIHLDGIPATLSEIEELDNILQGGVIF